MVNSQLRNYFKGRGRKMGVFEGGGGGGGVDVALGFKNFWDGVYNFFFCPPLDGRKKCDVRTMNMIVATFTLTPYMYLDPSSHPPLSHPPTCTQCGGSR